MIHNHLENNREITTKTGLIRSLRSFYSTYEPAIQYSYQVHDTIATSFIITANYEDMEYQSFLTRFNELANMHSGKERTPGKHCEKNMWLIKPAALNQGKGIEVCRNLKEIQKSIRSKPINSLWVIQKYIEKPLLFKGRKFDIRMWAIATGKHEFFYYKHGYLRTSSSEYDTQATDTYIHLTNNCLQKYGEKYGAYEKGNTLSFEAFQEYLDTEYPQYNLNFITQFLPRIKDLMIDSYLSAKKILHKSKRKTVFELLGFDFLIDEDFRVWLIEVNTNPYLGVPNEYIEKLLPNMLDDMLDITVDQFIPPLNKRIREQNDFELIYAEHGSAFNKEGVNYRQAYNVPTYPVPELSQLPLSKHCVHTKIEDDQPKFIVKDLLQSLKHVLENPLPSDLFEFNELTNRVMSQISNWELLSEEQLSNSLQALKLISSSNILSSLVETGNINIMIFIISSENIPESIQTVVLEAIISACHNMKFRKSIVKNDLIKHLINLCAAVGPLSFLGVQALITLCNNPSKGVYIPGKTREHSWVKEKLILEGGLLALMNFSKAAQSEKSDLADKIEKVLASEFNLSDWESQITLINKVLTGQIQLPPCLTPKFLEEIKIKLIEFNSIKHEEIKIKQEKERIKKEEENQEIIKKNLIIKQQIEEKRLKAEEYINKRYEEIRRDKLNEMKKNEKVYGIKTIEDKLVEEKRYSLLNKLKKAEELKTIQENKLKKQEQDLRKLEKRKKNKSTDRRKQFIKEYIRARADLERLKMYRKVEDYEKQELDKIFNKLYYPRGIRDKPGTYDDQGALQDLSISKVESSKFIDSLLCISNEKKDNSRKISPIVSKYNLFTIYGKAFSNNKL
jgi:Tubulin-tyrosine ligase family